MAEASPRPASSSTPLVRETHRSTRLFWMLSDTNVWFLLLSEVLFSFQLVHLHDLYHTLNSVSTFQINQAYQIYMFFPLLLIHSLEACYRCSGLLLCGGFGAEGGTRIPLLLLMKSCWSVFSLRRSRGLRKNVRGTVSRLLSSCFYLCGDFLG